MAAQDDEQPLVREQLADVLCEAEVPATDFKIGAEGEKIGVHAQTGAPLGYGQAFGVCRVLEHLRERHGWTPLRERDDAPVIGLRRAGASVTLEPGAQLELSGAPLPDLHAVWLELQQHLTEISDISAELDIAWLGVGFQPLARLDELPWVPKLRYPIMRAYLPTRGPRALDMMQRTATVQANFDRSSERDGMHKLQVALRLSPILHALFANAPLVEGRPGANLSERGAVWLGMDPARSGLIPRVFDAAQPSYQDYVEWALDAGMFLFKRAGQVVANTGQTFRDFLARGYEGHRATRADWVLHLSTLFPEVRLKNTVEVRPIDSLPPELALAAIALFTGLLYDDEALTGAEALTAGWRYDAVQAARPRLVAEGLAAPLPFSEHDGWTLAERLLDLARAGLERRGRPGAGTSDEAHFLRPAERLVERRVSPAGEVLSRLAAGQSVIEATRQRL
jgi:glutamate--cysteine ligase